jgi:hypothetical protein
LNAHLSGQAQVVQSLAEFGFEITRLLSVERD